MSTFVEDFDCLLLDLDGTVFRGHEPTEGAVDALAGAGIRALYVTNNASRSAPEVAAHLCDLGFSAGPDDVVTSAQSAAHLLAGQLPSGSPVLVVGTDSLAGEITAAGDMADVLALIGQLSARGELVVMEGEVTRSVFFEHGNVVGVQTNAEEERIGMLLYKYGVIGEDQIFPVLERARKGDLFGRAAVELGLVGEEVIYKYLARQVEEVVFAVLAGATLLRVQRYPEAWADDCRHPVRHTFIATLPVGLILLAAVAMALDAPTALARGLWWLGSIGQLLVTLWVLGRWFLPAKAGGLQWASATPALFIPIVGNVLVPLAGVPLGHAEWSAAQFGIGLLFWPVVMVLLVVRIATQGMLPERLLPTLFILIAPPAVVGLSAAQFGAPPLVVWAFAHGALGQAVDNLVANAIEAMPEGGALRACAGRCTRRSRRRGGRGRRSRSARGSAGRCRRCASPRPVRPPSRRRHGHAPGPWSGDDGNRQGRRPPLLFGKTPTCRDGRSASGHRRGGSADTWPAGRWSARSGLRPGWRTSPATAKAFSIEACVVLNERFPT